MYQFIIRIIAVTLFIIPMATTDRVHAADTTEVYDIGATDFEFFVGFEGIGLDKYEKELSVSALAGFGFIDAFSGYLAIDGASNEYFTEGSAELSVGVFGTPLDTNHVDLDLVLNFGAGADHFEMTPGLELNLDLRNDLELAGLYLRLEETFTGRDESSEEESEPKYVVAPQAGFVIGAYWSVIPEHQILLEYEMGLLHNPSAGERRVEVGAVALGYNLMVVDSLELLGQLSLDIPQKDEDVSVGVMLGLISTMPSVP